MEEVVLMDSTFQKEVLDAKGLVLVDFWATWCGPCLMLAPIIEELGHENKQVKVCKMDVDQNPETSAKYGIMSIPTVMLIKDGTIVETFIGVQPKAVYQRAIEIHSK
ncbi:MAG TPA: thioredoxin [Candidatus Dojkabacteria bacterium]|nr:thioredoxin [Candidatus Dojkabacteria bacterium]